MEIASLKAVLPPHKCNQLQIPQNKKIKSPSLFFLEKLNQRAIACFKITLAVMFVLFWDWRC
ncbi:hypothetical protein A6770_31155 [Nostoc minutum NIES-26]|uniref:Uncharacterized protein n=1 Tax=Nostoc minutum NIES-26 TaxID=1844469 RepID=A0A367Q9A6_9NOSO|nr:hypothetical protein A6770_31155 [Nostoc minutum NIES-26]